MLCRIDELKNKQVVCVSNGCVLGFVSDVELDVSSGCLNAIVIFGRYKLFGLFGKEDDIIIPWCDIRVIGDETVLVSIEESKMLPKKTKKFN